MRLLHMHMADQLLLLTDIADGSDASSSDDEGEEPELDSQAGSADQEGKLPPAPVACSHGRRVCVRCIQSVTAFEGCRPSDAFAKTMLIFSVQLFGLAEHVVCHL